MAEQIAADESPLVQYAQDELRTYSPGTMSACLLVSKFWDIPKARQLAIARADSPPFCSDFAKFIMWAVEAGGATDKGLSDVLFEYLKNPQVKKREYQHEDLWRILPKVPEGVAWKLVGNLSAEGRDDEVVIPPDVLDWLQGDLLSGFLCRKDVKLKDFRRKVFLSTGEKYANVHRIAAASNDLELSFEQFHSLLKERSSQLQMLVLPEKFSDEALQFLSLRDHLLPVCNLPLKFMECLKDYFYCRELRDQGDPKPRYRTIGAFENKIGQLRERLSIKLSYRDRAELRELRIYRLAKGVMPWGERRDESALCDPLRFLADKIVEGDTWATFMAFYAALSTRYDYRTEKYMDDQFLPILPEMGETGPPEKSVRDRVSQPNSSVNGDRSDWLNWTIRLVRHLFR